MTEYNGTLDALESVYVSGYEVPYLFAARGQQLGYDSIEDC